MQQENTVKNIQTNQIKDLQTPVENQIKQIYKKNQQNIIYTKINNTTINQTFPSIRNNIKNHKQTKRTRRPINNKTTKSKLKILYSNVRGTKSKMKSLKEIVYSKECDLFTVTETNLKQNENIVLKGYKWVGKIRQERDGGGVGILIKDTLINGITIEPITATNIEIFLLKVNLNNSEYLIIMI